MGGVGPGDDGRTWASHLARRSVAETVLAAAVFAVAMGFAWVNHDAGDPAELAAPVAERAAAPGQSAPTTIPPSQPAVAGSFTESGETSRPAPVRARIIDPETGDEMLVALPAGSTVVNGEVVPIGSTGTTRPGGSSTTEPPTTEPPTTEPPTTEPPTTEPPTTEPPTTEPPTTEPPTTEAPQGPVGGLLGQVGDLLD
jgi:hypothetical protein